MHLSNPLFSMSGVCETEERCLCSPEDGHARSMSFAPRGPVRAAHPTQQRPDGTKRSRHVKLRRSRPVGPSGQAPQKQSLVRGDPDVRVSTRRTEEKFRCECRSVIVSPGTKRDACDAEGRVVGHKHERVRSGMTVPSRCRRRATSPFCIPEREAGAVALASRAQETSRTGGLPRVRNGRMMQC